MVNCCGHEMSSSVSGQGQQPLMRSAPELVNTGDLQCGALWLCGIASCVFTGTQKCSYVGSEPQVQLGKGNMGESWGVPSSENKE